MRHFHTKSGSLINRSPIPNAKALIIAVGIGATTTASHADTLCAELSPSITLAASNFTTDDIPNLSGANTCKLTRSLSGSRAYHCSWSYPYRSEVAANTFNEMAAALQACFGDTAKARTDQQVNHPDTYDQLQYKSGEVAISLSLKDKAALNLTFISIGVTGVAGK